MDNVEFLNAILAEMNAKMDANKEDMLAKLQANRDIDREQMLAEISSRMDANTKSSQAEMRYTTCDSGRSLRRPSNMKWKP
jgi:hypothetical protein